MLDEENLVQRAQQKDEAAFTRLYEQYSVKIYRYVVVKVGNSMEAEDITQQVFLNAFRSLPSFKWKGQPFSSWLFRIAHNQIVDYLRKKTKRITEPLIEETTAGGKDPEELVERKLSIEQLVSATKHLTRAQQEVISLRFAAELSVAEAAKVMGRSEGAVKALQHSAIVALRKELVGKSDGK
ncbi:MAG: sigma-70 family RNA polymerase sigma factor [Chloroflexi bacterium]|nr:sigma-70 family RNA polymerase sigma factor [Chloroflexota bacterium]